MLVSIVVPVYKVEKYLRQCLDSILAQTFRDMEIIVVDDGSPDGCPGIIDEYAAKDSRVVAVHQQNGGYGKAVNAGIARAKGKYVGIVESDDYIESDMYASLVEAAERTGADLTRCTFSIFDGKRDFLWDEVRELNARDGDVIDPHEELDYFLYHSAPWCYLYRRELFETVRISESKGASYQDLTLVAEAVLAARSVAVVGRPLLHYRMENGQGSSCSGGGRNLMAIVDRCEELKSYMEANGFSLPKYRAMFVRKAVRAVNWFYQRIDAEYRSEFFMRLRRLFSRVEETDPDWFAVPLDEKLWLWTVIANREDLSWPVLLQQEPQMRSLKPIIEELMKTLNGEETDGVARMFGALSPAFADCSHALLMASDRNYLPYLSVCIASIVAHASDGRRYDFIVFVDFNLVDSERLKFDMMCEGRPNVSIRFYDIRRHFAYEYFRTLFVNRHLSLATYYRFAAPYVLSKYNRCLWLDCDTVALEDVASLFDTDLSGFCVGGCRDLAVTSSKIRLFRNAIAYLKSLGYRHENDYVCAGVLLFNLTRMRAQGVVAQLLKMSAAHEFRMHDQDALNLVCQDEMAILDDRWDFIAHENPPLYPQALQARIAGLTAQGRGIWHFAGAEKAWYAPWKLCNFIWWQAARLSPYYEELLLDLSMKTAGVSRRNSLSALRERVWFELAGRPNPGERKIKYLLPYGFMRWYVKSRYGLEVDVPLVGCPWSVRLLMLFKLILPYGFVCRINGRYAG